MFVCPIALRPIESSIAVIKDKLDAVYPTKKHHIVAVVDLFPRTRQLHLDHVLDIIEGGAMYVRVDVHPTIMNQAVTRTLFSALRLVLRRVGASSHPSLVATVLWRCKTGEWQSIPTMTGFYRYLAPRLADKICTTFMRRADVSKATLGHCFVSGEALRSLSSDRFIQHMKPLYTHVEGLLPSPPAPAPPAPAPPDQPRLPGRPSLAVTLLRVLKECFGAVVGECLPGC